MAAAPFLMHVICQARTPYRLVHGRTWRRLKTSEYVQTQKIAADWYPANIICQLSFSPHAEEGQQNAPPTESYWPLFGQLHDYKDKAIMMQNYGKRDAKPTQCNAIRETKKWLQSDANMTKTKHRMSDMSCLFQSRGPHVTCLCQGFCCLKTRPPWRLFPYVIPNKTKRNIWHSPHRKTKWTVVKI